jgi:hypothetical protein
MLKQKFDYDKSAHELASAIDLAIDSLSLYPPKGFLPSQLKIVIDSLLGMKKMTLDPKIEYKNQKSLKFLETDALQYFQESGGLAVEYFWAKAVERGFQFERRNALAKILKQGKLSSQPEYDLVVDLMIPCKQLGLISEEQIDQLSQMILAYEAGTTK